MKILPITTAAIIALFALTMGTQSGETAPKSTNKTVAKHTQPTVTNHEPQIRVGTMVGGKRIVKTIPLETYLRSVLPKEMPPNWHSEALKAQAVAARTFALKNLKRHAADGFDLCDTTHCQTYVEGSETESTNRAIKATVGEVLTYNGSYIDAVFHTDSGGMTENSENVWGTALPYLRATKEEKVATFPWSKSVPIENFAKAVGVNRLQKIQLSPLTVGKSAADRGTSGRVKSVKLICDKNVKTISGNELRKIFGLPSTLFDMKINGKNVVFTGFGSGHGLGMSQHGANTIATKLNYREILQHYYAGTNIKKL